MLSRIEQARSTGPAADNDQEFSTALRVFSKAYAGRPERLVAELHALADELAKPSTAARAGGAVAGWFQNMLELATKTAVTAYVQKIDKPS